MPITPNDPNRKPFTPGVVTEACAKVMGATEPGDTITYDQLDAAAKRDVRVESRHSISSARNMLLRDKGIVFVCIPDVGYQRLENSQISGVTWRIRSEAIQKTAIRGMKEQCAVQLSELPADQQTVVIARMSAMKLLKHASRNKIVERLLPSCGQTTPLPIPAVAALLLEKRNGTTET